MTIWLICMRRRIIEFYFYPYFAHLFLLIRSNLFSCYFLLNLICVTAFYMMGHSQIHKSRPVRIWGDADHVLVHTALQLLNLPFPPIFFSLVTSFVWDVNCCCFHAFFLSKHSNNIFFLKLLVSFFEKRIAEIHISKALNVVFERFFARTFNAKLFGSWDLKPPQPSLSTLYSREKRVLSFNLYSVNTHLVFLPSTKKMTNSFGRMGFSPGKNWKKKILGIQQKFLGLPLFSSSWLFIVREEQWQWIQPQNGH